MKAINPQSSDHILEKTASERMDHFKECWAGHRNIEQARDKIMRFIREPANVGVIHLVGPTGVGKSTLLRNILKKVYEQAMPEMVNRPDWIPAAYMLAENPENGVYNWSKHFVRTMEAVQEVLIGRKIEIPEPGTFQSKQWNKIGTSGPSLAALRRAAEKAMVYRKCRVFIIDDAQYIIKRRSGEQVINQADTIKSIADQSETLHLLAGTYDLLPLRNLNGQLGRRSVTVHFSNYKFKEDADIESFIGVMKYFMTKLPLTQKPNFIEHWEFCYALCVGCIGVLKDWFVRSLDVAIMENKGMMTFDLFKSCKPPTSVSSQIAEEISIGEDKLNEENDEPSYANLCKLLGMNDKHQSTEKTESATNAYKSNDNLVPSKGSNKKRHGNIKTKPHRLPVGLNNDPL